MKTFYDKHKLMINAVILGLLPIIACIIRTLSAGKGICDVWLGASTWNDEFFYFKQIECMVRDGIPNGFFGYDESLANYLSFGAWTPTILLPWAIFGKVFGWSYSSVFWANILFLTVAMVVFALTAKPDLKKTLIISVLFLLFTPFSRYMLSSMPEIMICANIIVYMGLVIGFKESRRKNLRLGFMLFFATYLTMMRPFYVLFFVFSFTALGKKNAKAKIVTACFTVISVILYFVLAENLQAPYIGDVYSTEWLKVIINDGLFSGIGYIFKEIFHYAGAIASACIGAIIKGYGVGIYFFAFLILMFIYLLDGIRFLKNKKEGAAFALSMFSIDFAMLMAVILMYSLHDGFRHLIGFIVAGLVSMAFSVEKRPVKEIVVALSFLVLFVIRGKDPVYFAVPYNEAGESVITIDKAKDIRNELEPFMPVSEDLSWDNTVDMVLMDSDDVSKDPVLIAWQYGYALPKGLAVNLCTSDFLIGNMDSLKSRYIMVMTNGTVEEALPETAEKFFGDENISIYKLR